MKKIISSLLVLIMMFVETTVLVNAEDKKASVELSKLEQERIRILYNLGIIDSIDLTNENVTRGEFSTWLIKLLGMDSSISTSTSFSDVDATNPYSGSIAMVAGMGYMNGISETEFGVNKTISVQEATASIVRLLGYEISAQREGGYPDGYTKIASSINLYKNLKLTGKNNRTAIALLCYNALVAPYVDYTGHRSSENTLLEKIHGVFKDKGVVTGTRFTKLHTEKMDLDTNEIEIDGNIYLTDDIELVDYLGEEVTYYYINDDEPYLVYLKPDVNRDKILTVDAKDIDSVNGNSVTYYDENDRLENIKLSPGFDYVVNNRVVLSRNELGLDIPDGSLTFIDLDNDQKYDLVKAKRIETMTFQSVDDLEARIFCKEGQIYTDLYDDKYYCEIIRVDEITGEEVSIEIDELEVGDILTVYRSLDDKYVLIYAYSSEGIQGVFEAKDEESIVIDGVSYEHPIATPVEQLVLGNKVTFSTDMFGRLFKLEESINVNGPTYGYLFAYGAPKGLENGKVKIIAGDERLILPLADKVKIDDKMSYSGEELEKCTALFSSGTLIRQLIKYDLNSVGEVDNIYTTSGTSSESIKASNIDKDTPSRHYPWYDVWAGKYRRTGNTFFMVIPDYDEEERSNDELYGTTYEYPDTEKDIYCTVYDVDDMTMEAGAILFYSKDPLNTPAATDRNTKVGVITAIAGNADGPLVYINTNGVDETFEVKEEFVDVKLYTAGDIVRYVRGADGKLITLEIVLDVDRSDLASPKLNFETEEDCEHYFGRIYNNLGDFLVMVPNRNNESYDDSIDNRVTMPLSKVRNCILVDMRERKVKAYAGNPSTLPNYIEGEETYYVYTRVFKFDTIFDLIIYKF